MVASFFSPNTIRLLSYLVFVFGVKQVGDHSDIEITKENHKRDRWPSVCPHSHTRTFSVFFDSPDKAVLPFPWYARGRARGEKMPPCPCASAWAHPNMRAARKKKRE
nr:hypothetical protein [Pandoravirus massiliensis]